LTDPPSPSTLEHILTTPTGLSLGALLSSGRTGAWTAWEDAELVEHYIVMLVGVYKPTPCQFYTANVSDTLKALGVNARFLRADDIEQPLTKRLGQTSQLDGARGGRTKSVIETLHLHGNGTCGSVGERSL
jgi:hypothetical protein